MTSQEDKESQKVLRSTFPTLDKWQIKLAKPFRPAANSQLAADDEQVRWAADLAGVTEIAGELGVHKSTVSRLVAVLESRGFVEQLADRGKYRLGFAIVRLAGSTSARMDLAKEGQAICDRLAQQTGETTNLAILDGDRIVNVVEAVGPAEIALRSWVGQNCPAHATSSGKALLSGLDDGALRALLGDALAGFTPHTLSSLDDLLEQLRFVRTSGWASACEELEIGLNAVGAPVRDASGTIVAALSVSGPAYRLNPSRFEVVAEMVTAGAAAACSPPSASTRSRSAAVRAWPSCPPATRSWRPAIRCLPARSMTATAPSSRNWATSVSTTCPAATWTISSSRSAA